MVSLAKLTRGERPRNGLGRQGQPRRATLEKEITDAEAKLGPIDELLTKLEEAQDARSDA